MSRRPVRWAAAAIALFTLAACAGADSGEDSEKDDSSETRTVQDSRGEVTLPQNMERIVTLHHIATQPLVNLGTVPVGRGPVNEADVAPETWELLVDVPVVSDGAEPDLEQIAALEPDLIIGHNSIDESALTSLESDVAPVLTLDIAGPGRADWRARVELVAESLDQTQDWTQLDEELDARLEEISTSYASVLEAETFSLLDSWSGESEFTTYGPGSISGNVFTAAGVTIGPAAEAAAAESERGDQEVTASNERLPELIDGSVVLYGTNLRAEPACHVDEVMDTSVFESLPAATAGQVYPGGKYTVGGFEDAHYNLDLLEEALKALA